MSWKLASLMAALSLAMVALAAPVAQAEEARPNADEDCVMQCDKESDKCMDEAGTYENKAKACDDRYTECLSRCR
jgi:hypothetical protein